MSRFAQRRTRLRRLLKDEGLTAMLVTNFTNVTYLTGFTGDDSYLLVSGKDDILISDPRYTTQLEEECPGLKLEIRTPATSMLDSVAGVLKKTKVTKLGIEGDSLTVGTHAKLREKAPAVELVATAGLVEQLREIKDKQEIADIRLAVQYAEKGFQILRATLRPERTEKEVADDLEHQLRLLGASGTSFPPIIAVGPRAALPHARPTAQRIGESPLLLVDWGATAKGYKSDLTRIVATDKISPKLQRVYEVVLTAQQRAIEAIRPGKAASAVDAVARKIIADAGFGKQFGHGLGHGLGLDIHEAPRLSAVNNRPLQAGMVVTVEPGVYLPGLGGVRIEDDVLVTKDGYEVLTSVPKQLADIYQ